MSAPPRHPPPTRRDDIVDQQHGQRIPDPYRWLENGDAPEVKAWTAAQNAVTRQVLDAIPGRAELGARLKSLFEIGSLGTPVPRPLASRSQPTGTAHGEPTRSGGRAAGSPHAWRYFFTRREGSQNQAVLYVRDDLGAGAAAAANDRVLLDPNLLAADGTRSLDWWFPSEDGRLLAYGISADGSEQSVLHVRDVDTGRDLPDEIPGTRAASVAWLPDGSGFYYTRYPAPGSVPAGEETYHRRVYFHALGAAVADDPLVFGQGRDMKDWPSVILSPNGRFVVVEVSEGWSKSEIYLQMRAPLPAPSRAKGGAPLTQAAAVVAAPGVAPFVPVAAGVEANFEVIEVRDDAIWLRTNQGAPRYQAFRVPLPRGTRAAAPARRDWKLIIPEASSALQQVALVGKKLAALYLEDATSRVRLSTMAGKAAGEVTLPVLGTVSNLSAHPDGSELFLSLSSFLTPTTIVYRDLARPAPKAGKREASSATMPDDPHLTGVWRAIPSPLAPDAFVVRQERVRSRDGTTLPLFLVHRRDLFTAGGTGGASGGASAADGGPTGHATGGHPTVLYGYGGFDVNITPSWTAAIVPLIERGGVYALAVLRGGGEYGEAWHQAGMLGKKQNVFDDFIASAEHLIATGVTSPDRLGIVGRSNGGLLIGATIVQRPELFRAAIAGVPLMDMLRYHKFRIAQLWIPEYGSPDDPTAFAWLRAYSPYHNVRDGVVYPATLLSTAESDTRVDPLHARKMTARLQAAEGDAWARRPILLREETQAGHGAGKPLAKVLAQAVDEWSFLMSQLGLPAAPER